jgi:hypothetical protein
MGLDTRPLIWPHLEHVCMNCHGSVNESENWQPVLGDKDEYTVLGMVCASCFEHRDKPALTRIDGDGQVDVTSNRRPVLRLVPVST